MGADREAGSHRFDREHGIVHLGLGAFHRAHQAWYTQLANDRGGNWGIQAFTGRSPAAAQALAAQGCVYTLIERGPQTDTASTIESIVAARDGADAVAWRRALADPAVAVVTLTVTEAGYRTAVGGGLNFADSEVQYDLDVLAADDERGAITAPGRLVDGLRARWRATASPLAIVSCDNVPDNGRVTQDAVRALAERIDVELAGWIDESVSFVSTMVDRITPATTDDDRRTAALLTGVEDAVPVVTEPFSEWVLCGEFPAGRPSWDQVGAQFVENIEPYEQRKLWLLNAAHSLLAYRGLLRGHRTVAEAFADADCAGELERLWVEARAVLDLDDSEVDPWLRSLRSRFSNPRIEHRLSQIAADGSQKLPSRVIEVIRRRVVAGLDAGEAEVGVLVTWSLYLAGPHVADPRAEQLVDRVAGLTAIESAVAAVAFLAPDLARDDQIVRALERAVADQATPSALNGAPLSGAPHNSSPHNSSPHNSSPHDRAPSTQQINGVH